MTHEDRTRAAAELAREHCRLIETAWELIAARGDWRPPLDEAVRIGRLFYEGHCPRWEADEREVRLGWVGTAVISLDQLRGRSDAPPHDRRYLTPEHATAEFRRLVAHHWKEEAETYRRHCVRVDLETVPAEAKVAETVGRVMTWRAQVAAA